MKVIENGTVTNPKGYQGAGLHIGIKKRNKDFALIVSDVEAKAVGTFTTNMVKAAPVLWDKQVVENGDTVKAIAINSGIANACTGKLGNQANEKFASIVGNALNVEKEKVLICSTGVIGKQLSTDPIEKGIDEALKQLKDDHQAGIDVATSIMTTDTKPKHLAVEIEVKGKMVTIGACCKGSGMIHPNMATMLGFITTDLNISKELLNKALKSVIPDTFNMISVDRDTSTNDTVLLLANGLAGNDEIVKEVKVGNVHIFHTRFTKKDRAEKENHIISTGKNEGGENEIWITTSVVEASLDIDFDYLFTELQDLNSLFQRMGRCNRKGKKPIDETNCFVYTKIDSNLISNGSRGFIDRTMYNLSKEAISEVDGVISESDKLNLINTYFTTDKVRNSEFFEEYYKYYGRIKNTPAYALDISEIEVRHIRSVDIIPKELYYENEERYESIIKQLENEEDKVERIKLLEELSENVVSIPYYDFDRTKNCKDIKINGRHYYWVLDCEYDSKIGFKADRKIQNYATFW